MPPASLAGSACDTGLQATATDAIPGTVVDARAPTVSLVGNAVDGDRAAELASTTHRYAVEPARMGYQDLYEKRHPWAQQD